MINWRHPKTVLKKCIQLRRAHSSPNRLSFIVILHDCMQLPRRSRERNQRTVVLADVLTHICIQQFFPFFCFRFVFSHVYLDFVCLPRYKMTIIEGTLLSMIVEEKQRAAYLATVQQLYREDISATAFMLELWLASLCFYGQICLSSAAFCINPLISDHFRIDHGRVKAREFSCRCGSF